MLYTTKRTGQYNYIIEHQCEQHIHTFLRDGFGLTQDTAIFLKLGSGFGIIQSY